MAGEQRQKTRGEHYAHEEYAHRVLGFGKSPCTRGSIDLCSVIQHKHSQTICSLNSSDRETMRDWQRAPGSRVFSQCAWMVRCEPGKIRIAARSGGTSETQNHSASISRRGVAAQSEVVTCRSIWHPPAHAYWAANSDKRTHAQRERERERERDGDGDGDGESEEGRGGRKGGNACWAASPSGARPPSALAAAGRWCGPYSMYRTRSARRTCNDHEPNPVRR